MTPRKRADDLETLAAIPLREARFSPPPVLRGRAREGALWWYVCRRNPLASEDPCHYPQFVLASVLSPLPVRRETVRVRVFCRGREKCTLTPALSRSTGRGSEAPETGARRRPTKLAACARNLDNHECRPREKCRLPQLITTLHAAALLGLLISILALAGCQAVGPDYKRPDIKTPAGYAELAGAAAASTAASQPSVATSRPPQVTQWWATFNDPELDSLIDRAVQSNLDLRQAGQRVLQARAQLVVAGADQYPDVDLGGGYQNARGSKNVTIPSGAFGFAPPKASKSATGSAHSRQASSGGGKSAETPGFVASPLGGGGLPGVTTNLYQVGFDAAWELDVFGGIRRSVEASGADLDASIEDRRNVLVTLLAEVARDYVTLRGTQRQIAIAGENLQSQVQTLGLTKDRFNNGFTTQLDVARAQAQVDATAATIPTLEASERSSMHQLAVLLGQAPQALLEELSKPNPIPHAPPEVPVGIPSELLRRRPDIRRAERQLAAATARIGAATADLYPKFSLTGSFGLDATKPRQVFNWESRYFALSPSVVWPVFDAGRIRANIRVQDAAQEQALTTYESAVLTAMREVEDALVNYGEEQARNRSLVDAVEANRLAVKLASDQYKQGTADFLNVLDVQRSRFDAEDALAQSDRTISANLVALYKALGGGWEIENKPK
jgi:multidrug efflux system outer membrane protein